MMATPRPSFATVIHLATGNVLAAVSSGGLEPTLEDLTGADHVRVRFPDASSFVNVPISALTAARVAVAGDVLDRPQHFVLAAGSPSLTVGLEPVFDQKIASDAVGRQAVVVWQAGGESIVASGPMGAGGTLPGTPPPGTTHQLVSYEGGPLHLDDLTHRE